MGNGSRVALGVLLLLALLYGLRGTFDYATERGSAADPEPAAAATLGSGATDRAHHPERPRLAHAVASPRELVRRLSKAGFSQVVVLRGARPERFYVEFSGEDDAAARTFYDVGGRVVSVGQLAGVPLPEAGTLVRARGGRSGIEVGGVYFWSERGYVLSVAGDRSGYFDSLRWRSTR